MTLAGTQSAQAVLVTTWSYQNTDGWSAYAPAGVIPNGVEGSVPNPLGQSTVLEWGVGYGQPDPSSLVLGSNNANPAGVHTGTVTTDVFSLANISAEITHNNNVITASSVDLATFTLSGTIQLTPLVPPLGGMFGPVTVNFLGTFTETLNASPCFVGSSSECDDVFVLTNPNALTLPFSFAGEDYAAYLTALPGTNFGPLSDAACAVANAPSGCYGWQTVESGVNFLQMALNIRSVPEPSSLALLALGLVGVGVTFSRNRRKFV
jgi:hypothetical protein